MLCQIIHNNSVQRFFGLHAASIFTHFDAAAKKHERPARLSIDNKERLKPEMRPGNETKQSVLKSEEAFHLMCIFSREKKSVWWWKDSWIELLAHTKGAKPVNINSPRQQKGDKGILQPPHLEIICQQTAGTVCASLIFPIRYFCWSNKESYQLTKNDSGRAHFPPLSDTSGMEEREKK